MKTDDTGIEIEISRTIGGSEYTIWTSPLPPLYGISDQLVAIVLGWADPVEVE